MTINSCGSSDDAPLAWWNHSCASACTYDSGSDTLTCDADTVDSGRAQIFAVATFSLGSTPSSHDYSVYGTVDNTSFCCVIDDDTTDKISLIVLDGTSRCDDLRFSFDDGSGGDPEENLEPAHVWPLNAEMRANAGPIEPAILGVQSSCLGDYLYGSNFVGGDYVEELFGGADADHLYGLADKDYLDGGTGDDWVEGGLGNDVILGGCGADQMYGQDGNDTICDSNGTNVPGVCPCNLDGDDLMDGGDSSDYLWYADTPYCSGGTLNAATTCDDGANDNFGDDNIWSSPIDNSCEVPTNNAPDCTFPW